MPKMPTSLPIIGQILDSHEVSFDFISIMLLRPLLKVFEFYILFGFRGVSFFVFAEARYCSKSGDPKDTEGVYA